MLVDCFGITFSSLHPVSFANDEGLHYFYESQSLISIAQYLHVDIYHLFSHYIAGLIPDRYSFLCSTRRIGGGNPKGSKIERERHVGTDRHCLSWQRRRHHQSQGYVSEKYSVRHCAAGVHRMGIYPLIVLSDLIKMRVLTRRKEIRSVMFNDKIQNTNRMPDCSFVLVLIEISDETDV